MDKIAIGAVIALVGFFLTQKYGTTIKETGSTLPVVSDYLGDMYNTEPEISLDTMYHAAGSQWGVDWRLLKAIAMVESTERPNAKNPSDPSYGLMQLLCVPDGKGGCSNKLNVIGWPPTTKDRLYDPEYSLDIAAQILRWNQDQYGFSKGIAVYNAWSAHTDPSTGPFRNQVYVDKVLRKFYDMGGKR